MKLKNYLLLSGIALFAAACSSNDDDNNQQMMLKRVETYHPSKAKYEIGEGSYKVQYYDNGEVVLDSLTTYDHIFIQHSIRESTGNTSVLTNYNQNGTITTTTFIYDNLGRLLKLTYETPYPDQGYSIDYEYTNDGQIISTYIKNGNPSEITSTYTTNENGIIGSVESSNGQLSTLVFEGGDVKQIITNSSDGTYSLDYSYYNIAKPNNLQLPVVKINNYTLINGILAMSEISKHYLKYLYDFSTFDSTFNDSNYIIHSNFDYHSPTFENGYDEIFYYYN